jgi:hypothetical protein
MLMIFNIHNYKHGGHSFVPQNHKMLHIKNLFNYLLIEYLGNLYNNRLESLDNTSVLGEEDEEEDENTIDSENNIKLEGSEELILKGDLNLDQSLKNALYEFQQINMILLFLDLFL